MTKIEGSESGSISQRHESPDLAPPQNGMDPQHCKKEIFSNLSIIYSNTLVRRNPPRLPRYTVRRGGFEGVKREKMTSPHERLLEAYDGDTIWKII
jgi:hypothetical protein